jgi:hypothetical protein
MDHICDILDCLIQIQADGKSYMKRFGKSYLQYFLPNKFTLIKLYFLAFSLTILTSCENKKELPKFNGFYIFKQGDLYSDVIKKLEKNSIQFKLKNIKDLPYITLNGTYIDLFALPKELQKRFLRIEVRDLRVVNQTIPKLDIFFFDEKILYVKHELDSELTVYHYFESTNKDFEFQAFVSEINANYPTFFQERKKELSLIRTLVKKYKIKLGDPFKADSTIKFKNNFYSDSTSTKEEIDTIINIIDAQSGYDSQSTTFCFIKNHWINKDTTMQITIGENSSSKEEFYQYPSPSTAFFSLHIDSHGWINILFDVPLAKKLLIIQRNIKQKRSITERKAMDQIKLKEMNENKLKLDSL